MTTRPTVGRGKGHLTSSKGVGAIPKNARTLLTKENKNR